MTALHPLRLVPTDPGGPERGDLLEVGDGGTVRVLRRSLLGRREAAARPLADVRAVAAGTASQVSAVGWLTPGAQIAAGSVATPVDGEDAPWLLAVAVAGEVSDRTWLFAGSEPAVRAAARSLGAGGAPGAPPAAPGGHGDPAGDGWWSDDAGGRAPAEPAPPPPPPPPPGDGGAGAPGPAPRRRSPAVVVARALVPLAVAAGSVAVLSDSSLVTDALDRFTPTISTPDIPAPAGVPSLVSGFAPHRAVDLVRVWSDPARTSGPLGRTASAPPVPAGRTLGAGFTWRGRPFRVVLAPSPAEAAAVRPRGTARAGNLVFRDGAPRAARAALVAALGRARRGPGA